MKKISTFDLVMIIVFVVIGLLGGGAWWYLSGQLDAAKKDVSDADGSFKKYSSNEVYLPTESNIKILKADTDLMKGLIDPLIKAKLLSSENKVFAVAKQDPVAWKSDLDERVNRMNNLAKLHNVMVQPKFYYSFSRYLNTNPSEDKTVILTKQLLGIEQIVDILINAPVIGIQAVRRTYDEDESAGNNSSAGRMGDKDVLPGRVIEVNGGVYADYPFEVQISATTVGLRKVLNDLVKSPYVFVVRDVTIKNSKTVSPQLNDLDKIMMNLQQAESMGVSEASPGAAAAPKPPSPPQYLFGGETLDIKLRIDMIEWKGLAAAQSVAPSNGGRGRGNGNNRQRNQAPGSTR